MTRYVAIHTTPEEVEDEGLKDVIPLRVKKSRRKLTMNCLKAKTADTDWLPATPPDNNQKRKLFGLVMAIGIDIIMSNHTYLLGDQVFLQSDGGPIGLDGSGAIARVVMLWFDELYLDKVKSEGYNLVLYERYVDDSNQIAVVPPPGSRYDTEQERLVMDTPHNQQDTPPDERLARILLDIANSVMECVVMEGDWPTKNDDKKMPILDMKVWVDESGTILYQHYEKKVSSKTVLNAKSAHSSACKRSVHTQEVLRRLFNTSHRLDWEKETAPIVTDYMKRMKDAGYCEKYRRDVLQHALQICDSKWEEHR